MIPIIICIIIYLLSVYVFWKYTSLAYYHPKGRFYGTKTNADFGEIVLVFFPVVNTFLIILIILISSWKSDKHSTKAVDFFKPRNPYK